jgi:hypothetical protein
MSQRTIHHALIRILLLASGTWACSGPSGFEFTEGYEEASGEPVGSEAAELSSLPKGHIAFAEASHASAPSIFASWGYVYYAPPTAPSGPFELLAKPSSAPKALAAVRIPISCTGDICSATKPHQCVYWIEGSNVRGMCESRLGGWGSPSTLSSTNVEGGQIRRLIGVSEPRMNAPALVALNTANKVLVNWYRNGAWTGWCAVRTLQLDGIVDFTAYQTNIEGKIFYYVNRTLASPTRTEFYRGAIYESFVCDDAGPPEQSVLVTASTSLPRFTATFGAIFALDEAGTIHQYWESPRKWVATVQPEQFQSLTVRIANHDGADWDALYGLSTDGSAWESEAPRTEEASWHRSWREIP